MFIAVVSTVISATVTIPGGGGGLAAAAGAASFGAVAAAFPLPNKPANHLVANAPAAEFAMAPPTPLPVECEIDLAAWTLRHFAMNRLRLPRLRRWHPKPARRRTRPRMHSAIRRLLWRRHSVDRRKQTGTCS